MLMSVYLASTEIETVGTLDDDGSVEVVKGDGEPDLCTGQYVMNGR